MCVTGFESLHEKHEHFVPTPTCRVGPPTRQNACGGVASVGIRRRRVRGTRSISTTTATTAQSVCSLSRDVPLSVIPDAGSPSFAVGPGDAVYFMHGFRCTWRILESPLVQHYGYFGADGKEIKDDTLITRSHAMCAVKTVRRSLISMMTRWTSAPGASSSMPNPRNSGRMQSINVGGKRFDFTGFKMTHIHSQSPKKCTRALTQKTYTLVRSSNAGLKPEIVQLEWIVHLAVHRLHQVMLLQAYGRSRMM